MKLTVFRNEQKLNELELQANVQLEKELGPMEFYIGRAEECHVVLPDQKVSRQHAVLLFSQGKWNLKKTTNYAPIMVNGSPINDRPLKNGDVIGVGPFNINVNMDVENVASVVEKNVEEEKQEDSNATQNETVPATEVLAETLSTESIVKEDEVLEDNLEFDAAEKVVDQSVSKNLEEISFEDGQDFATEQDPISSSELADDTSLDADNFSATSENESDEFNEFEATGNDENALAEMDQDQNDGTQFITTFAEFELRLKGDYASFDRFKITTPETFIGRESGKCQIVLRDPEVSAQHAKIIKTNISCQLHDLNSGNGVFLNGEKINIAELNNGDVFTIGSTQFSFVVVSDLIEGEEDRLMPVEENQEIEKVVEGGLDIGNFSEVDIKDDSAGPEDKSLVGKWKKLPKQKKIIYGAVLLALLALILSGDPDEGEPIKKSADAKEKSHKLVKEEDKGEGIVKGGKKVRVLSPQEKETAESLYILSKELFAQGKYSETIFELQKIFNITDEYKKSKQLYELAKNGLAKLEEIEKKRQAEIERKIRIEKVKKLLVKADAAVKEKKAGLAESLFSQILELDPENYDVPQLKLELDAWKKEQSRLAAEKAAKLAERKRQVDLLQPGKTLYLKKDWYKSIVRLEEFLQNKKIDEDLITEASNMLSEGKKKLANLIGPMLGKARSLREGQDLKGAYQTYVEVLKVDPSNNEALNEIDTIKTTLDFRSRKIYREALIDESLSLFEEAKEKLQEVQQVSPTDSKYYKLASEKLKNYLE